jgi:hypothetical protein
MKNLFRIFLAFFCFHFSFSQEIKTAVFDDGTEVSYQLTGSNAKDIPRFNLSFLDFNSRSTLSFGFGAGYTNSDLFSTRVHAGFLEGLTKLSIENTIYFMTFEKNKSLALKVKSASAGSDAIIVYKIKENLQIRNQLGARIGYLHGNYNSNNKNKITAKANEVAIGVSLSNTIHYRLKVLNGRKPKESRKTQIATLYAELINYHSISPTMDSSDPEYNGFGIPSKPLTGYRLAGEIHKYSNHFGGSFSLGVQKPLHTDAKFGIFAGAAFHYLIW